MSLNLVFTQLAHQNKIFFFKIPTKWRKETRDPQLLHKVSNIFFCLALKYREKKNWEIKLKLLMMEFSLCPVSEPCQEYCSVYRSPGRSSTPLTSAVRYISMAVVMYRASRLQLLGFPREIQNTVEDLPFDGHKRFSETMNDSLNTLKESRAILHSLGIYYYY